MPGTKLKTIKFNYMQFKKKLKHSIKIKESSTKLTEVDPGLP